MRIADLAARLSRAALDEALARAIDSAAARLADAVRANLSHAAGESDDYPALRTGELRDSIDHASDGQAAVVGSMSRVALFQELGTATDPPRPFLAPAAAALGAELAREIGAAAADALRG